MALLGYTVPLPYPVNSVASGAADRQATVSADRAPLRIVYGRDRIGAQVACVIDYAGDLVLACVWGKGPVEQIESVTLDDKALPAGITVTHYTGTTSQTADPTLVAAFAAKGKTYSDTLANVAYSVFRIPAGAASGWPNLAAIVKGRKLYDPRKDSTNGGTGTHRLATPSTWEYSDNPTLALADFIGSTVYGWGKTLGWPSVITCANFNDTLVGGTEKQRLIGLTIGEVRATRDWIEALRAYASVLLAREGNTIRLVADTTAASVYSFLHASGHFIDGSLRPRKRGRRNIPTVVTVRYTDTGALPWRDAEAVAKAAGVDAGTTPRREQFIALPGITRYSQAYREALERLNKLALQDLECEWQTFDEALKIQVGDVVSITHPLGFSAKQLRVLRADLVDAGRWRIAAEEYDPAAYSTVVVSAPTYPDTDLPSPANPPTITGLTLSEELYQLQDGSLASRIRATWTRPVYPFTAGYWVELKNGSTVIFAGRVEDLVFVSPPVQELVTYGVYVSAITSIGVRGAAATGNIAVLGKTVPPPDVTSFLVSRDADGTRRFSWTLTNPPLDLDGYKIRYKLAASATWSSMSDLHTGLLKTSPYETNQLAAGQYTFAIKAVDSTGNESVNALYITLTLGDPRLAGVIDLIDDYADGWPGTKTSCYIEPETGYLVANSTGTWSTAATWSAWTVWNNAPVSPIIYERLIDVGVVTTFTPLVTTTGDGTPTITEAHSNDNVSYTSFAAIGGPITCRYIKIRVSLAGSYPRLTSMVTLLSAEPKTEDINDLVTSTLSATYRSAAGQIRLPITESYSVIKRVEVALQGTGSGWTWKLIDKNTSPGPLIYIYNGSGVLSDATIDATVRGL